MARLGDIAPLMQGSCSTQPEEQVWLLTLDKVESETGAILDYTFVDRQTIPSSTCEFDTENVLYSKLRPYLNKVVVPHRCGYASSEMLTLRPKAELLDRRYLAYFLRSPSFVAFISGKVAGAKMPRADLKALLDTELALRSLPEQQRIATLLDKVSELIMLRNKQIARLDQLTKARFVELFGDPVLNDKHWPILPLGEVAELRIGPFGSLLHKEDYISGGHPIVNPSHIVEGKIRIESKLTISTEKYNELAAYQLQINDIVLARRGEMGRCAVVDTAGMLCGTGSMVIRPKALMQPYFLQTILSQHSYKKKIEEKAVGVTMMNINVAIASSLPIPVLPLDLQEKFIALLEAIEKVQATVKKSLSQLKTLKVSLMQQYFG